jgi:hypothetical protein
LLFATRHASYLFRIWRHDLFRIWRHDMFRIW